MAVYVKYKDKRFIQNIEKNFTSTDPLRMGYKGGVMI